MRHCYRQNRHYESPQVRLDVNALIAYQRKHPQKVSKPASDNGSSNTGIHGQRHLLRNGYLLAYLHIITGSDYVQRFCLELLVTISSPQKHQVISPTYIHSLRLIHDRKTELLHSRRRSHKAHKRLNEASCRYGGRHR